MLAITTTTNSVPHSSPQTSRHSLAVWVVEESCQSMHIIQKNPTKWGIRLFVLAESDTGYVHSIIPNYRKRTGNMCNSPYSEKPFISIVFSWMDRLWLSVSGIEDYHHFTDRYYSCIELAQELDNRKKNTFGFLTVCPCCTNFSGKTVHLVAKQAFKNPWQPGCGNFSTCNNRKGLNIIPSWKTFEIKVTDLIQLNIFVMSIFYTNLIKLNQMLWTNTN
jgi:hypothetical protein